MLLLKLRSTLLHATKQPPLPAIPRSFQAFLLCVARVATKWVRIHLLRMTIVARLRTVTQLSHPASLLYTVLMESATGPKLCEDVNHQKSHFDIFTSRFRSPAVIIYDNACKLHAYCLNREPRLYQNTRFFIDRFHWRGYVGCSSGYL